MRISTTMQYTSSLSYIQNGNSKVDDAANRYNKGTKFDTAGEDPSGCLRPSLDLRVPFQIS